LRVSFPPVRSGWCLIDVPYASTSPRNGLAPDFVCWVFWLSRSQVCPLPSLPRAPLPHASKGGHCLFRCSPGSRPSPFLPISPPIFEVVFCAHPNTPENTAHLISLPTVPRTFPKSLPDFIYQIGPIPPLPEIIAFRRLA